MAFDKQRFTSAQLAPRTAEIAVPGMWEWFETTPAQRTSMENFNKALEEFEGWPVKVEVDGEMRSYETAFAFIRAKNDYAADKIGCKWTVCGLSDDELERCRERSQGLRKRLVEAVTEILEGGDDAGKALLDHFGIGDEVHPTTALRIEHVFCGSVEPKIEFTLAVKLAHSFPVEFKTIANKIMELTGLGAEDKGKLKPSGAAKASSAH